MKFLAALFGITVFVLAISWIAEGNDFFLYKVFAPKYEDARRNTLEHSKSYRDGMVQNLRKMQFEYIQAAPTAKPGLGQLSLSTEAGFDETDLPPDLMSFINGLREPAYVPPVVPEMVPTPVPTTNEVHP
jgi:hypothetical protein